MCEVVVCDTSVKVKQGDITTEKTDAIVNLNNATLDQNFGVSKVILDAAGDNVKEECERLGKLPSDGIVVTSAGNLKCRKIIHLINVKPHAIVESVKKALKACDQHYVTTVSLPAIGTGSSKLEPINSVKLITRGIEEYLADPATMTSISDIIIVVFDPDVYKEYLNFFQNYQTNYPHFTAFGKTIELIKGDITDQAVDCILNLTNSSLNQSSGVSGAILAAAGDTVKEECKEIGTLKTDKIAITSGGKLKSKNIMHIIGPTRVPDYEPSMDRILLECHNNGFTSFALPAIGTGIAHVDPQDSIIAILSSILNYLSETCIPTLETICIIVLQEPIYKTYLKVFQEKCTELQAIQREENILSAIHAQDKFDYPGTWTDIVKSEFQEVNLDKDSQEYKEVKTKFKSSSKSFHVVEIKRIQSVKQWQSFTINKRAVSRKNPGKRNLHHLYHGTKSEVIKNINREGFNRIYSGENGTAYGYGTYFAVKSDYSCGDRYSVPDSNGNKYVYQAAVITGRYCKGSCTYREPPYIDNDPSGDRYDSVTDDIRNPSVFVTFHDDYAYPEYLITFKPKK
ncbi:protein mono-ADP-ribosyltransferase PARP15-like [Pseudophryne corroboree]|uniref:protein mono-ADP-ribosyltransferase PARP15-like n=1 Tax=Pseudophryne corroboree TaxID=495146 RepID=UPI0030818BCD